MYRQQSQVLAAGQLLRRQLPAMEWSYRDNEELMPRFVAAVNNPFVNVARDARVSFPADGHRGKKNRARACQAHSDRSENAPVREVFPVN